MKIKNQWHLNVPKILHVYWSMTVLPYIHFKTVDSFIRLNPDWEVWLWYSKTPGPVNTWPVAGEERKTYIIPCTDYLEKLKKLPVKLREIDVSEYGLDNGIAEVHKSDFFRYIILNSFGGVWSDMDILYFKPITNLLVNNYTNTSKDTFVCISSYGHSIGFLMSCANNVFFNILAALAKRDYRPNTYQCIGTRMLDHYFPNMEAVDRISPAANIGMESVYTYNAYNQLAIINDKIPKFSAGSIGCHWYGGHRMWEKFIQDTDGGLINLPNNIMGNLLK